MFNTAGTSYRYSNWKILGGVCLSDYNTHITLFAGPDPSDSNRVLIRKLVQTSDKVWCFEESRITPSEKQDVVATGEDGSNIKERIIRFSPPDTYCKHQS